MSPSTVHGQSAVPRNGAVSGILGIRWILWVSCCAVGLIGIGTEGVVGDDRPWLTESQFTRELNRPISVLRPQAELRPYLEYLSDLRSIAILLDRRIDPGQVLDIDVRANYFDEGISQIVSAVEGHVVVIADTLFVTQSETAKTLRTRVQRRLEELDQMTSTLTRRVQLQRRFPVSWDMLTSPREILEQVAQRSQLKIENPDAIPYDQWWSGSLAHANVAEALMLILNQFDLEFEWISLTEIRIVPTDPNPLLQREYRPRGLTLEQGLKRIESRFPERNPEKVENQIRLAALLEEHEEVAVLVGERPTRQRPAPMPASNALDQQRFTLRVVEQPFGGLVGLLRQRGIAVDYDEMTIAEARIDLNQRITLELEKATLHELLTAACGEVGLDFRITDEGVVLFPRPRAM